MLLPILHVYFKVTHLISLLCIQFDPRARIDPDKGSSYTTTTLQTRSSEIPYRVLRSKRQQSLMISMGLGAACTVTQFGTAVSTDIMDLGSFIYAPWRRSSAISTQEVAAAATARVNDGTHIERNRYATPWSPISSVTSDDETSELSLSPSVSRKNSVATAERKAQLLGLIAL